MNIDKRFLAYAAMALTLLGYKALLLTSSSAGQVTQEKATEIDTRPITEKQKAHSKLYSEYKRDQKIRDIAATATQDVELRRGIPMSGGVPDMPPFNLQAFLKSVTCEADLIIVGTVKDKQSQLTEDETFIFTDYELKIKTVLKNNPTALLRSGSTLDLTYPGGAVQINERIISATDNTFKPLGLDKRYLLFLKYLPETGSYRPFNSKINFQVVDEMLTGLTGEAVPPDIGSGKRSKPFLAKIRAAISKRCER